MREATGELNMTVIVVIAVAGLMAFFVMLWTNVIKPGIKMDTNCSNAICEKDTLKDGMVECHVKGKSADTFQCPYKG